MGVFTYATHSTHTHTHESKSSGIYLAKLFSYGNKTKWIENQAKSVH